MNRRTIFKTYKAQLEAMLTALREHKKVLFPTKEEFRVFRVEEGYYSAKNAIASSLEAQIISKFEI